MRNILNFACEGAQLAATLDVGSGSTGLLIVSGGNEVRMGAHRGMAMLAAEIAAYGHPVFRFDRRGIGDSEGENGEFTTSGPDVTAAIATFHAHCPHLTSIIAFGNCDAATALLLHNPDGIAALVLGNIWVIERHDDLPPPAAIKARYAERLKDPHAWMSLFTGAINLKKLIGGLWRLAKPAEQSSLAQSVANRLTDVPFPTFILLAKRDATALAFTDVWGKPLFEKARNNPFITVTALDSTSHSFANESDHAALVETLLNALSI